jgi:hypothetical protein
MFDRKQKAVGLGSTIFSTTKNLRANQVLGQMTFGEMWNTPQLQATDLLTYEAVRRSLEERHDPSTPIRRSLQRLGRKGNLYLIHLDEERLRRYLQLVRDAEQKVTLSDS